MGSEAEHVVKEREQRLLRLHEDFVLCIYLLKNVSNYPQRIGRTDLLTEFDESVFTGTVDCVIVCQGQGKNERQRIF